PTDYPTVDDALLAGETILFLEPGTYGPIVGAEAVIGDPEGGVIIDAGGADIAVDGAKYLRHLTITGAAEHGVYAEEEIRIHDCVIEGNGTTDVDGGGIWSSGTVVINDSVIQDNEGFLGGGMYIERMASLYAQQVVIADNNAQYGGGLYGNTTFGNVVLQNSMIVGNTAEVNGGAGVLLDTRAFLTRVTVADNAPGGIRLRYGYFEVKETIFAYNTVYGVDVADSPTIKFEDSVFGTADAVSGGTAPDPDDGNVTGDPDFAAFTAGSDWMDQDFRLVTGSVGFDMIDGQDRDGSEQDAGAYGGFLGRFPSGVQGVW
ncbi:MAG: right-handed parallel beta-helix repeat-containing protein, partial [Myxococcota bacterium]